MCAESSAEGLDAQLRLEVYRHVVDTGRVPSPVELAEVFALPPLTVEASLRRLGSTDGALVLLPDSPYIWMAEPFSAVPTSFLVHAGARTWWGNCIWDALAILALLEVDGTVSTRCPDCNDPLQVTVNGGRPEATDAVAHFAVAASDWWRSIGFT